MGLATTLAIASIGAAGYSTVKQIVDKNNLQSDMEAEKARQQDYAAKMQAQAEQRLRGDEQEKAAKLARENQRRQAMGAQGRGSTILTSPLGIPNADKAIGPATILGG
jgi:uncharacterized protein HemX